MHGKSWIRRQNQSLLTTDTVLVPKRLIQIGENISIGAVRPCPYGLTLSLADTLIIIPAPASTIEPARVSIKNLISSTL